MDASEYTQRRRTIIRYSNVVSNGIYSRLLNVPPRQRMGIRGPVPDSIEIDMRLGALELTPAQYDAIAAQAARDANITRGAVWTQIANYINHSAALKSNGTLWTWGINQYGQLGVGTKNGTVDPVQVNGTWSYVTCGQDTTYALKPNQTLWSWGRNYTGQLGVGDLVDKLSPIQVPSTWKSISAAFISPFGIKTDGTLWVWGDNSYGQFGDGTINTDDAFPNPIQIGTATNWVSVYAMFYGGAALNTDNELWMWGLNISGECGQGDATSPKAICQVPGSWKYVTCGARHTIAQKTDGTWWCWGFNLFGQLGLGDQTHRLLPTPFAAGEWAAVYASGFSTFAITATGEMFACGWNFDGQLGLGNTTSFYNTLQPVSGQWLTANTGGVTYGRTTAISTDGRVSITGLRIEINSAPILLTPGVSWSSFNGGQNHTIALQSNGTLWTCGSNFNGQLSLNDTSARQNLTQTNSDVWAQVTTNGNFTMARKSDNSLWVCGRNVNGQYGNGTTNQVNVLTEQTAQTGVLDIIAGSNFSMIIKLLGGKRTLYSAGSNSVGQLGRTPLGSGPATKSYSPIGDALAGHDVTFASGGSIYALAIRDDGTLWAWGINSSGQLGVGDQTNRSTPTQVGTDTTWVFVAAGKAEDTARTTTAGIKSDGSLWIWGLLPGTDTTVTTPTAVTGFESGVASVIVGTEFIVVLKTNGTVWSWGQNYYGQLGLGDLVPRTSPTRITSLPTITSLTGGYYHVLARDTDDQLWCWGNNTNYQLGISPQTSFTLASTRSVSIPLTAEANSIPSFPELLPMKKLLGDEATELF